MKVSAEESRKTHDRIVDMAAKLFLESGFEAVSLSDIMSATGQTNGGFYKRFSSKDDLAEQAVTRSFLRRPATMRRPKSIENFIDSYVTDLHMCHPDKGCPLPSLGMDIARQNESIRQRFEIGFEEMLATIGDLLISEGRAEEANARSLAINIIAKMAGAIIISRALPSDTSLKDELLKVLRDGTRADVGLSAE